MPYTPLPSDVVQPIGTIEDSGIFVPATAVDVVQTGVTGLHAWDPWTDANLAVMADKSQPVVGEYGEPSQPMAGSITAEWGGQPSPVRGFQDMNGSVLLVRRQLHNNQGETGYFYGPSQTAWEASYVEPEDDYWSVITGG